MREFFLFINVTFEMPVEKKFSLNRKKKKTTDVNAAWLCWVYKEWKRKKSERSQKKPLEFGEKKLEKNCNFYVHRKIFR